VTLSATRWKALRKRVCKTSYPKYNANVDTTVLQPTKQAGKQQAQKALRKNINTRRRTRRKQAVAEEDQEQLPAPTEDSLTDDYLRTQLSRQVTDPAPQAYQHPVGRPEQAAQRCGNTDWRHDRCLAMQSSACCAAEKDPACFEAASRGAIDVTSYRIRLTATRRRPRGPVTSPSSQSPLKTRKSSESAQKVALRGLLRRGPRPSTGRTSLS